MVIDTMIFAYALLGVPDFCEDSLNILSKIAEVSVPDSLRSELVNVVWQWVSHRRIPLEIGMTVLQDADAMITQIVPTNFLWERALVLAVHAHHSAYDTLFVALAEHTKKKLVTYDVKLKKAFPELVITPADFIRTL